MISIPIDAILVNHSEKSTFGGRRYKTEKRKKYDKLFNDHLKAQKFKIKKGQVYVLDIFIYKKKFIKKDFKDVSLIGGDLDGFLKPAIDSIFNYLGENDARLFEIHAYKIISKKEEKIVFHLDTGKMLDYVLEENELIL